MDYSIWGFLVLYQLPELAHIHAHWVGDAIEPSHLLLPSSPLAFNLSQHQGLFQWMSFSHQVAKYWSFSISPLNEYSGWISFRTNWLNFLTVQGTTRVFSSTTTGSINSLVFSHITKWNYIRSVFKNVKSAAWYLFVNMTFLPSSLFRKWFLCSSKSQLEGKE